MSAARHLTPETRAAIVAESRAGADVRAIAARWGVAVTTVYNLGYAASMRRGRTRSRRADRPPGEYTAPHVGQPLRAPCLPWYTETVAPLPNGLEKLIVPETPRPVTPRLRVPLWPRGADEEALCI